jgi:CHAT domain-containing protein
MTDKLAKSSATLILLCMNIGLSLTNCQLGILCARLRRIASAILLAFLIGSPCRAAAPEWHSELQRFLSEYYKGHATTAIAGKDELLRQASAAGSESEIFALRKILEACFRVLDYKCIESSLTRMATVVQEVYKQPGSEEKVKKYTRVDLLLTVVKASILYGENSQLPVQQAVTTLEQEFVSPSDSADYIQGTLTLAAATLARGDRETAARYTQRAWMYFLSYPGTSEQQFVRDTASFIQMFRATGQFERAVALFLIAEPALLALEPYYKYDSLAALAAEHDVLIDMNQPARAADVARRAVTLVDELQLDPQIRSYFHNGAVVSDVVDCVLVAGTACDKQAEVDELSHAVETGRQSSKVLGQLREASTAIAMYSAIKSIQVPSDVEQLLLLPPWNENQQAEPAARSLYWAGRFFLAGSKHEANLGEFALNAAQSELTRLHALETLQPFDVMPVSLYTRIMFSASALTLARKTSRTQSDEATLLTLLTYLNRSPRNVESEYLHVLSLVRADDDINSVRALYRTEQHLFFLEKVALKDLVGSLWTRIKTPISAPVDIERWRQFSEMVMLSDDHRAARKRIEQIKAAEESSLTLVQGVLRPDERFVIETNVFDSVLRMCVDDHNVLVGLQNFSLSEEVGDVKMLQLALTNAGPLSNTGEELFPVETAKKLSQAVLGPTESECLGDSKHVIFAPDPTLLTVPARVLIDPSMNLDRASSKPMRSADVVWLGRARAISTVLDASEFVASRELGKGRQYLHQYLGIGNPQLQGWTVDGEPKSEVALRGLVKSEHAPMSVLDELPDTITEISEGARRFGHTSEVLLGADATELNVRRKLLGNYRVIAFATHGLLRTDIEGLTEAALVLSPQDAQAPLNDGLLTASEIAQLDLRADLVILSACNTARFDLDLFGPEAASLSSAFFLAGTRSTLATLWSVDSVAAARLISLFTEEYSRLPAPGAARALQIATARFTDDPTNNEYRDPRFWGAFTLYGDGSAPQSQGSIPTAFLEPIQQPTWPVFGEVTQVASRGDGILVSSYRMTEARRVTGQLARLDISGRPSWHVDDSAWTFYIPKAEAKLRDTTVIAWNYDNKEGLRLELRNYKNHKEATRYPVASLGHELFEGVVAQSDEGPYIIATKSDGTEAQNFVMLRVIDKAGTEIQSKRIDTASSSVGIFPGLDSFWVAVSASTGQPSTRIGPLGAPVPCLSPVETTLLQFSNNLEVMHATKSPNTEIVDVAEPQPGVSVIAGSLVDPCRVYRKRATLGIADFNQKVSRLIEVPILDFSTFPRRLIKLPTGGLALIGQIVRDVDFFHATPLPYKAAETETEIVRSLSPFRQWGGFLARMPSTLDKIDTTSFFAGSHLYFNDIVVAGNQLFIAGASGYAQLLGVVTDGSVNH